MPLATLTSKGQVTIPLEVRDRLGLRAGSRLQFVLRPDGVYEIAPATASVLDLKGMLAGIATPMTREQIDAALSDSFVKEYRAK